MTIKEQRILLNDFLSRWTIEKVGEMTLQQYVGIGVKDTFCQWVETKTRMLGSIKGLPGSIKFGIYERQDIKKRPSNYKNDSKYSWLRGYGENRNIAFENIREDILTIIKLSEIGRFEQIDNIPLNDMFKWKIAFLYSNERLIPIYKREVLFKIANYFGLITNKHTTISEIQNTMILNKPIQLNVYEFMQLLYDKFNQEKIPKNKGEATRKGTNTRNTATQIRAGTSSYVAEQKHNKIQETLKEILIKQYGKKNVILEENYVDIKLILPDYIHFYEVKSSSYAYQCIREALGQLLLYSLKDKDERPKKHIVVGQYPATESDKEYINYIKKNLKLDFEYINIEIKNETQ